jgi:hypothetical protein
MRSERGLWLEGQGQGGNGRIESDGGVKPALACPFLKPASTPLGLASGWQRVVAPWIGVNTHRGFLRPCRLASRRRPAYCRHVARVCTIHTCVVPPWPALTRTSRCQYEHPTRSRSDQPHARRWLRGRRAAIRGRRSVGPQARWWGQVQQRRAERRCWRVRWGACGWRRRREQTSTSACCPTSAPRVGPLKVRASPKQIHPNPV